VTHAGELPIDAVLDRVIAAARARRAVVVEAAPGAGKTTRVPPALLGATAGKVLVLEPRRLAARMAAARVAAERDESLGDTVGYEVRFERRGGPNTRLWYLTEGILTRRLAGDGGLASVGAVVLDEIHERHLQGDVALALVGALRRERPDLVVVAMSATLETGPLAALLDAEIVRCPVRQHEVIVEHTAVDARTDREPLERRVAMAVRRLVRDGLDGHVLVFLPGAAEIRRAADACRAVAAQARLEVLPLHGELSAREQDRAVAPSARRKLVLATNVAESSITIDGVAAVVDSGLVKRAEHAPWSGLTRLRLVPTSQASAEQRAGRAGRTRAGRCVRLYDEHDHRRRAAHDAAEILRADLSEAVLTLAAAGVREPESLAWLDPPPAVALAAAQRLLRALGALDPGGALTDVGRRMARYPLHPRLGRVLVEAERRGALGEACAVVALLGERGGTVARAPLGRDRERTVSLWVELDRFEEAAEKASSPHVLDSLGVDRVALTAAVRARDQLLRIARAARPTGGEAPAANALARALLAGHPDRVGRAVGGSDARRRRLALATGGTAELEDAEALGRAGWTLVLDARERGAAPPAVRLAIPLEPDDLLEMGDRVGVRTELLFAHERGRVERVEELRYDELVLEETREPAPPGPETARVLAAAARRAGWPAIAGDEIARLVTRSAVAARHGSVPRLGEAALESALDRLCARANSLAALTPGALAAEIDAGLTPSERKALAALAPDTVRVGNRALCIDYPAGAAPFVAAPLQDFFGMRETPRICGGALELVVHLLAPNGRAVQVTTDLASFWQRHYPELRRELSRRYPKHHWPDDPVTAKPVRLRRHA
jgi:ATP-dependent helicase HrpB